MFKLNENYEVGQRILKCDYIRFSPAETSAINTHNSQIYNKIPREHSVISLLNGYLDLHFEVIKKTGKFRYGDGNDKKLNDLGPIAFFSSFTLRASSEKHVEDFGHPYIVL